MTVVSTRVVLAALLFAFDSVHPQAQTESVLSSYRLDRGPSAEFRLAGKLREISGLAASPDGYVFAHDDEYGIIYQIDPQSGNLLKAFALGDRTIESDFEGVAVVDDRLFLVNSDGRLFETREGDNGERILFNTYGTGVGRRCEVEGLAFEPADRTLLIICKTPRDKDLEDQIAIFRWSVDTREMAADSLLLIPTKSLTDALSTRRIQPSGLERHPSGHYIIVAAAESVVIEITPSGAIVDAVTLPKRSHRQVEGITFLPDGRLIMADEGGRRRARLTQYTPVAR